MKWLAGKAPQFRYSGGIGTYAPRVGEKIRPCAFWRAIIVVAWSFGTPRIFATASKVTKCWPCAMSQSLRSLAATVVRASLPFIRRV